MRLLHSFFLLCTLLFLTKSACHSPEEPSNGDEGTDDIGDDEQERKYEDDDFVDLDYAKHVRISEIWDQDAESNPETDQDFYENDNVSEQDEPDDGDTNDEVNDEEGDDDMERQEGFGGNESKEDDDEKEPDDYEDAGDANSMSEEDRSDQDAENTADQDSKTSTDEGSKRSDQEDSESNEHRDQEQGGLFEESNKEDIESEYRTKEEGGNIADARRHRCGRGRGYRRSRKKVKVCTTADCIITAAEILRNMDTSVNPCHNFYDFACGRFPEHHQIRGFQGKLHSFALLRQRLAYDLHNILRNLDTKKTLSIIRSTKRFYSSCLNMKRIGHAGDEPQIKLVRKHFELPIKESGWPRKSWSIKSSLKRLVIDLGVNPLFSSGVTLDDKKASQFVFKVAEPGLNLPKMYYTSKKPQCTKTVDGYITLMKKFLRKYGQKDNVDKIAQEIFDFEKKLAQITSSGVEARDVGKMYKKMTVNDIDKILPEVGFKGLVTDIYGLVSNEKKDRGSEKIVVLNVNYFKKLSHVLQTSKTSTVAKYLMWNVIVFLGHFGPESTQSLYQDFRKIYVGTDVSVPRWKSCLGTVSSGPLGMVIGRLYIKKKFKKNVKYSTIELVKLIKKEFINNLKKISWMDEKTKRAARQKARSILALVAYPDWILNDKSVKKEFKGLKLDSKDYMGNYFKYRDYARGKGLLGLIHKTRNRKLWTTSPAVVNAFYSETYNRITIPAGILQRPFCHPKGVSSALLFGGIGTVVGHELTHGFDDKGRKYDKDGNYKAWWTKESSRRFRKRANCIRQQYSRYQEYGAHVNGALTAGENIADNGGVKVAYYAMKREERRRGKWFSNVKLPGLHFTNDQLFFIGFSQLWCTINRKAFTLQRLATDHHTPSKYRVLGVLSNMKEFSRAFNCPRNSRMNAKKKCKVW